MNCARAMRAVAETWGGAAPPPRNVTRHLRRCAACALEARRLEEILEEVARAEIPDPGGEYWDRFLPRLRARLAGGAVADRIADAEERARPRRIGWRPLALSGAAALLLAAAVLALWNGPARTAPESDLAALDRDIEERIASATPGARSRIADLFSPWESAEIAAADLDLGREEISDAIGRFAPILTPSDLGGLPDLEGILEGLSREEAKELLGEISGAGQGPARESSGGKAG